MTGKKSSTLVDDDGRTWIWDSKGAVWYAPDWGLEFETRAEIAENYGPLSDSSSS